MMMCTLFAGLAPCPMPATVALALAAAPAPLEAEAWLAEPVLPQQGLRRLDVSQWYLGISAYVDESDPTDLPGQYGSEEDTALAVDLGYVSWEGEMGVALEGGIVSSSFKADISSISTETVDTLRFLAGIRIADRGAEGSSFVPYARAGVMWRRDKGELIEDDGFGWYAGGGFDWMLTERVGIGPQFLYTEAASLTTREWLFGLSLMVRF